jgi:hypothetical protein
MVRSYNRQNAVTFIRERMHCKIRPFWDRVDALKILDQAALWMAQAFLRSARH